MDFETELQKCKLHPHHYIQEWMEGNLLHVGRRVMKILALQPCSLILPDIPFASRKIRANFNVLYLSNPSSGKSTLTKKYSDVLKGINEETYNPYELRKVTAAKLSEDLADMKMFTLILEDFAQIGNDYDVIKIIEGALGDEKRVAKRTKREETDVRTQGVGILAGTWNDLGRYLEYFKAGMLFRMVLLFVDLSESQLSEIGRYITTGVGNTSLTENAILKEKVVRKFYQELFDIQGDTHEKIKQIQGYEISEDIKLKLFEEWDKKVKRFNQRNKDKVEYSFTRELEEGLRFLCSSAFLNVFHRKVENNTLYPNEDDLKLAIELMNANLDNKLEILKSRIYLSQFGSEGLRRALQSNIPEKTKKILINLTGKKFSF